MSHNHYFHDKLSRRKVLQTAGALAACSVVKPTLAGSKLFDISLAQWSLHRMLRKGDLNNLEFPAYSKSEFDIHAVEYVNQFFKDKAKDQAYLRELKQRSADAGVKNLLIMCDGEGKLGAPDDKARRKAVENHFKWVEAAKYLGCHSIRVNASSKGSYKEQRKLAADGLRQLSEFAATHNMNVLVENHGGLSSHGKWLCQVIKAVDLDNCGTLPDFGNFKEYDRYKGVKEIMPFAKGVSAKSRDFDDQGEVIETDFKKMLSIVLKAKYRGYIGVEYEGKKASEKDGIKMTKALLEKYRAELSSKYA